MREQTAPAEAPSVASPLKRWLPLILLLAVMALVFGMGWHKYFSFKTIGLNYDALRTAITANLVLALLAYIALYIVVVALSLPGGLIMTVGGGLLFGWKLGAPAAIIGATIGAGVLFMIVTSSFGESLARKAGPFVAKLADGFKQDALSYLLFLRLVPAFPFFVVNLVPALIGVPLRTFLIGTGLGIIPATTAFSLAGSGLGSVIEAQNAAYKACLAVHKPGLPECAYSIDVSQIVTRELAMAGIALGIVSLIPVALKYWRNARAAG